MGSYVYYRLPSTSTVCLLKQRTSSPTFMTLHNLHERRGFLICPFHVGENTPIVLIEPEETTSLILDAFSTAPLGSLSPNLSPLQERQTETDYISSFHQLHASLQEGSLKKVVLARTMGWQLPDDNQIVSEEVHSPMAILFRRACERYPDSFVAWWHTAHTGTWLTVSPEPLLRGDMNRGYHTVALAGTKWGGKNCGTKELWDEKNKEEQAVVSDFIARKLHEVANAVVKTETHTVSQGSLEHLATDYFFSLRSSQQVLSLAEQLYPTPAVSGWPKQEAIKAILSAEKQPRRYYAGFCGPYQLSHAGTEDQTHLFVTIRCMEILHNFIRLYAGGGLLANSQIQLEWEETQHKLQTLLSLFHA